MTAEARCRFLYLLNLLVPGPLGLVHLLGPREAADKVWLGTAGKPTTTFPLLGSLWLAIALASIPGLYRPLKFSPIMLIQIIYKMIFLPTTILPLVLAGRWSEFPLASTAVFASYLPILLFCAPWGYWLGREGAREDGERKKGE